MRDTPTRTVTATLTLAIMLAMTAMLAAPTSARTPSLSLGSWMSDLGPLVANVTVLDLALPGTHDTLTRDLSERVADNANDLSPALATFLHTFLPQHLIGSFIRAQATSQGSLITPLLDAGTRFVDFRITYTRGPHALQPHAWYGLHFVESLHPALSYLQDIADWLAAPEHAGELVVIWFSRHGNTCLNGTAQYPGTTPALRQAFWADVKSVLGPLLIDASAFPPNATTVATLRAKAGRVLVYTSDWAEFTASDPAALDACLHLDNIGLGDVTGVGQMVASQLGAYASFAAKRVADKTANVFSLVSLATSSPDFQIEAAAKLRYLPVDKTEVTAACAAGFNIPNMTDWCPAELLDISQLASYYAQRGLEAAHSIPGYALPNAFYVDAVTPAGGIRTGSLPLTSPPPPTPAPHTTTEYAYVATVVDWFRIWQCSLRPELAVLCNETGIDLARLRAAAPYTLWSDPEHGRLPDWPVVPNPPASPLPRPSPPAPRT